uniref:Vacuolar protein sorting-associated protein 52 A isoform X3 n=1 Tax=Rhizophora mucronata TaxID=61149 RepID=A0A2P2MCP1_RHIMU
MMATSCANHRKTCIRQLSPSFLRDHHHRLISS